MANKHFMRIGVEDSDNQSFVAAISKVYTSLFGLKDESIYDFKKE